MGASDGVVWEEGSSVREILVEEFECRNGLPDCDFLLSDEGIGGESDGEGWDGGGWVGAFVGWCALCVLEEVDVGVC